MAESRWELFEVVDSLGVAPSTFLSIDAEAGGIEIRQPFEPYE